MSLNSKGLGRGLDALLGGSQPQVDQKGVQEIPLRQIVANKFQPRREFEPQALQELCDSIKAQGVLQPVLVRPAGNGTFELVAGERRMRASSMAGLRSIPALVKELTDQESLAIALIENLQREDLNPIEEALGYRQLQQEFGLSQEQLSRQMGKSRSALANALRLLKLPEEVQQKIQAGELSAGHGRALMAVSGDAVMELMQRTLNDGLTVRQVEAQAALWKQHGTFDVDAENGLESADADSSQKNAEPAAKAPSEERMKEIAALLKEATGLQVKAGGNPTKGKVTFNYNSADELEVIFALAGVSL